MESNKFVIAVAILAMCAGSANAFELRQWPLAKMVEASSMVVIAKVDSTDEVGARVSVRSLFSGLIEDMQITVITDGGIVELRPDCCVIGEEYLLFLKPGLHGKYQVVNGPYGAFRIMGNSVKGWNFESGEVDAGLGEVFETVRSASSQQGIKAVEVGTAVPPSK